MLQDFAQTLPLKQSYMLLTGQKFLTGSDYDPVMLEADIDTIYSAYYDSYMQSGNDLCFENCKIVGNLSRRFI